MTYSKIQLLFKSSLIIVLLLNTPVYLNAEESNKTKKFLEGFSKEEKMLGTNIAIASGILTWGFTQWGYGEEDFHIDNEGWFEKDTSNGGSDKLGHFYTNYLMTRAISPLYESWGYTPKSAALYGSLTSVLLSGILIEIGDGYSEHGFSKNDFIADSLGVLTGYLWYINPSLSNQIDFKVEYNPFKESDNVTDFTTDYERMKHLMAIKGEGFEIFEETPLEYLELHLGYFSRDFNHDTMPLEGRKRNLYLGIGINLSKLFRPYIKNYSNIFNYVQVPHSYVDNLR
ncbi:MAG: YfiM family protein [Epsilonproteobacteria bacterium]|nr:YfiM family protein [Campylobacterota bacterium]